MRLWRVSRYGGFDGEGARRFGGRWHSAGTAVIYAAASLALAMLEFLVHADRRDPAQPVFAHYVDVPEGISVETVDQGSLPPDWRAHPGPLALREVGSRWASTRSSLLLSVPSAVLGVAPSLTASERNYLMNPAHSDFRHVRVRAVGLQVDPRMWR